MKKKLFVVVLVLLCLVSIAWAKGEKEDAKMKFAFSPATLDNPYFIEVANGFKDQCKVLGVEAIVTDPKYDAALQNDQFENFISMGVKAMAACPVDQKGLQSVTQKAVDRGLIVISQAQKIDNASGHLIVDDYGYGIVNGTNAAKWINHKLGGKAKVLLITLDHVEAVKLRGDGMEDTIRKETNATIVARQYAETMEQAMNIADAVLTANPDLRVIACVNDQLALGALAAVQSKGIKADDFYIGGADYTDEAKAKMQIPGSYFRVTADIGPYKSGVDMANMMYDYAINGSKGETQYFDIISHWQDGVKISDDTPIRP